MSLNQTHFPHTNSVFSLFTSASHFDLPLGHKSDCPLQQNQSTQSMFCNQSVYFWDTTDMHWKSSRGTIEKKLWFALQWKDRDSAWRTNSKLNIERWLPFTGWSPIVFYFGRGVVAAVVVVAALVVVGASVGALNFKRLLSISSSFSGVRDNFVVGTPAAVVGPLVAVVGVAIVPFKRIRHIHCQTHSLSN